MGFRTSMDRGPVFLHSCSCMSVASPDNWTVVISRNCARSLGFGAHASSKGSTIVDKIPSEVNKYGYSYLYNALSDVSCTAQ